MAYTTPVRVEIDQSIKLIDDENRVIAEAAPSSLDDRQFIVNAYNALAKAANRDLV